MNLLEKELKEIFDGYVSCEIKAGNIEVYLITSDNMSECNMELEEKDMEENPNVLAKKIVNDFFGTLYNHYHSVAPFTIKIS